MRYYLLKRKVRFDAEIDDLGTNRGEAVEGGGYVQQVGGNLEEQVGVHRVFDERLRRLAARVLRVEDHGADSFELLRWEQKKIQNYRKNITSLFRIHSVGA